MALHPDNIEHIDMAEHEPKLTNEPAYDSKSQSREYAKFVAVIVAIALGALVHYTTFDVSGGKYLESFMGVFFLVFASFKLIGLTDFVAGFVGYDIVAKRYAAYAYYYPFLQLFFASYYLFFGAKLWLNILVLLVSLVSAYGVIKALKTKRRFECVCLGSIIKLPLTKISFLEDFGMALMVLIMLVLH